MADRHGSHDLEAIVAFADGELTGVELEAAAVQVEACRACADLVADLRSLALADRRLATPARPRDFQLTVADAERLGRLGPEPSSMTSRLGQDMMDTPATHKTHDPERIAAAVGGALEEPERREIDAWLASCSACAELHADLMAIASAERALPTPARPRDFRLSPADAQRLRPHGWRAILAAIGSSRDAFTKPLAVGLTTLGIVGLLVGTVPLGMGGAATLSTVGAAAEPYGDARTESTGDGTVFGGQDITPSAAPSAAAAAAPELSAAASAGPQLAPESAPPIVPSEAPADAAETPVGDTSIESARLAAREEAAKLADADGPSELLVVSLLMLVVGVGLFAARWGARRLRGT